MRFIDSSIFLYAYLKPRKSIPDKIKTWKKRAKRIIERINMGEEVATSIVHISEIANILEARASTIVSLEIIEALLSKNNIHVYPVDQVDYIEALEIARDHIIGLNDALAVLLMKRYGIKEIYSYDSDFDKIEWIKRITS